MHHAIRKDNIHLFKCQKLYDHIHYLQPQVLVSYKQGMLSKAKNTPEQYGVRTQRYKLIRYPDLLDGPQRELFDLQNDPTELNNLADDPKSKSVVTELRNKLDQLRLDFKDPEATP